MADRQVVVEKKITPRHECQGGTDSQTLKVRDRLEGLVGRGGGEWKGHLR